MDVVKIGNSIIGKGNPPFFVAELGICHEGSIDVAKQLVEAAAKSGAHCIKSETFDPNEMVFNPAATMNYSIDGETFTVPLIEHMEKYYLSFDEHAQIKAHCDKYNIPFISTAHNFEAIDFLVDIKASGIKIASPDLIHTPLLKYAAKQSLPLFLDTGGAIQPEIEKAVALVKEYGAESVIVNHNPVGHPALAENHDLNIIPELQRVLEVPVGISDHYEGNLMLKVATAVGANVLEKPISRDNTVKEPERNWSINVSDIKHVLDEVIEVYKSLGDKRRNISQGALDYRDKYRMSIAAKQDIKAGEQLTLNNCIFGRPRYGIGVEYWDLVDGRILVEDVKKHDFINWEHVGKLKQE